jgi:hypothetical protein
MRAGCEEEKMVAVMEEQQEGGVHVWKRGIK